MPKQTPPPKPLPIVNLFDRTEQSPQTIPLFNPGEMILRLTPFAQVTPSLLSSITNPLLLKLPVLKFLAELRQYGLWRIEPLVQLGRQVWITDDIPPGSVPPPAVPGPGPLSPPLTWAPASKDIFPLIRYGDNPSRRRDAIPQNGGWIKVEGAPPRVPGLPSAKQAEIRRRLLLRFDPSLLDERLALQIAELAHRRLILEVTSPMMLDIQQTPTRLIGDQPNSTIPRADWTIPPAASASRVKSAAAKSIVPVAQTSSVPTAEEVYPPRWYEKSIGYDAISACMKVAKAKIAVLDSGVDLTHPALRTGAVEAGFPDYVLDYAGHGTHVCSILVGRKTPDLEAGMLPSGTVVIYKVMSNTVTTWSGKNYYPVDTVCYANALFDLKDTKLKKGTIKVINLSLGGKAPLSYNERADLDALNALGAVIVAAAGNHDLPDDYAGVLYPAAYAATVSVGAYRLDLNASPYEWEFSNWGGTLSQQDSLFRDSVDIFAPGRNILAALPTYGTLMPLTDKAYMTGTSMAVPIVAAVIAAYLLQNTGKTLVDILALFNKSPKLLPFNAVHRLTIDNFPVCPPPK